MCTLARQTDDTRVRFRQLARRRTSIKSREAGTFRERDSVFPRRDQRAAARNDGGDRGGGEGRRAVTFQYSRPPPPGRCCRKSPVPR